MSPTAHKSRGQTLNAKFSICIIHVICGLYENISENKVCAKEGGKFYNPNCIVTASSKEPKKLLVYVG